MQNRPHSLAEIAAQTSDLSEFGLHVRDFLREWNLASKAKRNLSRLLAVEPPFLAGTITQGDVCDAFLAALAKHFAEQAGIRVPDWVDSPCRSLAEPWFALDTEVARSWLRREALPSFRERNLFVDQSALARL
jgi:hypothetical protein